MISIVIYGRNDSYGYNLHKRATLSLNCFAEVLTHKDDEILFVDYNSPNDFPTFPEAVQDLLTEKCKQKLKIIRLREETHKSLYASKTHLFTLEPIARNIAIRRMNPKNKWVLSTNTDMIFLMKGKKSLSEVCALLEDGNYSAPRFEIPETVWESFDRLNPSKIIKDLKGISKDLHLKEVVQGDVWNLFDAPGDFQMFTRDDIMKIGGFDEKMVLGWHCDSNVNRRLMMINSKTKDASSFVDAYHCDHTRQVTPMHKAGSKSNDLGNYVFDLTTPVANAGQPWGLADYDLEISTLNSNSSNKVVGAFKKGLKLYPYKETLSKVTDGSFEKNSFPEAHVLTFIADHLMSMNHNLRIGWIGRQGKLKDNLVQILDDYGLSPSVQKIGKGEPDSKVDVVIVRNEISRNKYQNHNMQLMTQALIYAHISKHDNQNLKFIFTDVAQTRFEAFVRRYFDCSKTPYSARILAGIKRQDTSKLGGIKKLTYNFRYSNVMLIGVIPLIRIWLLANRNTYKRVFAVARLFYYALRRVGFFR